MKQAGNIVEEDAERAADQKRQNAERNSCCLKKYISGSQK